MEPKRYTSTSKLQSSPKASSQTRLQEAAADAEPLPSRPSRRRPGAAEEQSVEKRVTYSCTQCSKHDLQVSIVMKALVKMIGMHEDGYTDILDDFDPIVRRLYLEKGYQENRKKPATGDRANKKKVSLARGEEGSNNNGFVVLSSDQIRLPKLSEPELFGEPKARWSETYNICPLGRHTVGLSGSNGLKTIVLDTATGRIASSINHGLKGSGGSPDIFNMVSCKDLQVYFQGSGQIAVLQQEQHVASPEEKFLPTVRLNGFELANRSRGVHLNESSLYFIGARGNVCKFDMKLVARAAEQKKTYRAEHLPTGTVVDFTPWGRNRILSLSERGVITLVESYRSVKQTQQVAEEEVHTSICSACEVDSKVLVASYCVGARRSTFRLVGEDLKELYVHPIDNEGTLP